MPIFDLVGMLLGDKKKFTDVAPLNDQKVALARDTLRILSANVHVVQLDNGVSLDFLEKDDDIDSQHYAFLIDESEFDATLSRIQNEGLRYWSDPAKSRPNEINHNDGGRGVYFEDLDGHLLEVITRPYGNVSINR
jgi:catechol 2,3-dioxygenase-like lactoylglutathione lyase family enzyme